MLNSEIAKKQQALLRDALKPLTLSIEKLVEVSEKLYAVRSVIAVSVVQTVDRVVSSLADVPQAFPKVVAEFWSEEEKLKAQDAHREALKKASLKDADTLAELIGVSPALLLSLVGAAVPSISAAMTRVALMLGKTPVLRAALVPAAPLFGPVLGVGLTAYGLWSTYDTSKKNARVAEDSTAAQCRVKALTAKFEMLHGYVLEQRLLTVALLERITADMSLLLARNQAASYLQMSSADQELLGRVINTVMAVSALLTKTAEDVLPEAQAEAEAKRSAEEAVA